MAGPSAWERRKLQAMRDIQTAALALFDEHGYTAVTVERVAGAAAVSASSIYRYFGTKEMLVLWDEYDPQIFEVVRMAGGERRITVGDLCDTVVTAAPLLIGEIFADPAEVERIRRRMSYVVSEPDVRMGQLRLLVDIEQQVCDILRDRLEDVGELQVKIIAAQSVWGVHAAIRHWIASDEQPIQVILNRAVSQIAEGVRAIRG
ncbi:TetR family transcriptional regulator [Antrihabitans sp. YC3-6]|uniref:TetR family transcriptional regulator n=1 Tax=Antrihabitans stalagmiti TaxID=2799499 RepID=A0A934U4B6_9NOCA|nr:TetR family transcriptional regulator [Antrihabitans stalagmiti]MBJ8339663.1 TetR family transcriptional regulator [Antrihabitans stalagmiti]